MTAGSGTRPGPRGELQRVCRVRGARASGAGQRRDPPAAGRAHAATATQPNQFNRPCSLVKIVGSLTIGWPLYLFFNVSGRSYPGHRWVNHFDPWSPIFRCVGGRTGGGGMRAGAGRREGAVPAGSRGAERCGGLAVAAPGGGPCPVPCVLTPSSPDRSLAPCPRPRPAASASAWRWWCLTWRCWARCGSTAAWAPPWAGPGSSRPWVRGAAGRGAALGCRRARSAAACQRRLAGQGPARPPERRVDRPLPPPTRRPPPLLRRHPLPDCQRLAGADHLPAAHPPRCAPAAASRAARRQFGGRPPGRPLARRAALLPTCRKAHALTALSTPAPPPCRAAALQRRRVGLAARGAGHRGPLLRRPAQHPAPPHPGGPPRRALLSFARRCPACSPRLRPLCAGRWPTPPVYVCPPAPPAPPCPQDTHVCHHLFSQMPHYHAQASARGGGPGLLGRLPPPLPRAAGCRVGSR